MKDFLLVAGLLAAPATVSVQQYQESPAVKQNDPRLSKLQKYFGDRDCPLRDSAKDFLIAADQNELDWRLLPSISIIESSGGKDYIKTGFYAKTQAEEAKCPDLELNVLEGIEDVTGQKPTFSHGLDLLCKSAGITTRSGLLN